MKRLLSLGAVTLALLTGSLTGAQGAPSDPAPQRQAVDQSAQRAAVDYWTPDRMRSAIPAEALLADQLAAPTADVVKGAPQKIAGRQAGPIADVIGGLRGLLATSGELYTGGGEVVKTTGKVFFTLGGADYVCSGSSTVAANESLVQTAGHCLNEGPGDFATNFIFVPQYDNGSAPFGEFAATELFTTTQWAESGDINYDVGYAKVGTVGGATLTDTVGAQGVGFNQPRGEVMHAFGYPAAAPYDGQELAWCSGQVATDPLGTDSQGMACNMTGGSSGGPWFIDYDETAGIGTLNSVNSFKYTVPGFGNRMYGPYFGSAVQSLYTAAQN